MVMRKGGVGELVLIERTQTKAVEMDLLLFCVGFFSFIPHRYHWSFSHFLPNK